MSAFSGKYDVCDWFNNKTDEEIKKSEIYIRIDEKSHKLDIQNRRDLIPYYPYLVGIGGGGKDGKSIVHISSRSYVDEEEKEIREWHIRDVKKEFNRCKRKKIRFIPKEIGEKLAFFNKDKNIYEQIAHEIIINEKNAEFDFIHFPMQEYYRKQLYEEMIKNGYEKKQALCWCFNEWHPDDAQARLDKVRL